MIYNIQILRILAAMLVVTHHSTIEALNAGVPATMMDFMGDFGSSGVDIFLLSQGLLWFTFNIIKTIP